MKKLLETLYVMTPESYVYHRNNNICISIGGEEKASVPITQVDSVVFFGKNTLSTSLIEFCGENDVTLTFLNEYGRFYGRVCGAVSGNVLLRKRQYDSLNDKEFVKTTVRYILLGKFRNSKSVLMRYARSSEDEAKANELYAAAEKLTKISRQLVECEDVDSMRGLEGAAATIYFSQFDNMLVDSTEMKFEVRSKRPPLNEVNATLSFVYTLLTHDCRSALETVGLDPAAGYLHTLRPGRASFALDLIEELRSPLCDRFVISLINRGQLTPKDFERDSDAVYLNEKGRRKVVTCWRERKQDEIVHPFFKEKIKIGLIPYTQAMLFARVLRGDLDMYPPFVWR